MTSVFCWRFFRFFDCFRVGVGVLSFVCGFWIIPLALLKKAGKCFFFKDCWVSQATDRSRPG